MIHASWEGKKLVGNGVVIAEIKPHMDKTFKVAYTDRPDFGPNGLGYADERKAKLACEKRFNIALT